MTVDYDLMYALARRVWHLRDELERKEKEKRDFPRSDIGPRQQTADSLSDFYNGWRKSFHDAWQVLTDLGNLLDHIGKTLYDADASVAGSTAQQVATLQRQQAEADVKAYEQRMDAKRKKVQADDLRMRYAGQERRLRQERAELAKKRAALEKRQEELQLRQMELARRNDVLDKEQAPLDKRQEELQKKQQALWREQLDRRNSQEAALKAEQDALDAKYQALSKEQEPLLKRQDELQKKQQALWREELDLRHKREAAFLAQQAVLQREQDSYDAKQKSLEKKQEALWAERNALLRKKNVTQAELDAWQKKQDALTAEQDTLWKQQGEPLQKKWEDLQKRQQEEQKAFEPLTRRQQDLDNEQEALIKDQEPLAKRQDELLGEQKALWKEHRAERERLAGEQGKQQDALDSEHEALNRDQDRFQPWSQALQKEQEALWKDQGANDEALKQLGKDDEALGQREEEFQKNRAEAFEELEKQAPWKPESGKPDPLYIRRGQDPHPEAEPPPVPKEFERVTDHGTIKVSYRLDDKGEIKLDKSGQPVETTTTITNNNGLRYEETTTKLLGDGDYRTVTRGSDGSVTKVVMDADAHVITNPEGGSPIRYVANEDDQILQIWKQRPGGGEWELQVSTDDPQNTWLGRLPTHLRVDTPVVDETGRPNDGKTYTETTRTFQPDESGKQTTVSAYKASDGSVTKVITSVHDHSQTRYVTDANGNVLEFWSRGVYGREDGTTYVHPWELTDSSSIPRQAWYDEVGPGLDPEEKRKADQVTP
ncbi:hypothetical protein SNL152K_898 [Streptomyces sp. NL15-2K]|nr:hypothetical protein SNL152K_898 [Streptomyces sp. NL15-2K]